MTKPRPLSVPRPKRKAKPSPNTIKDYVVQFGHAPIASQVHRFDTEARCKAAAIRQCEQLVPNFRRYNSAGLVVLEEIKEQIAYLSIGRERRIVDRVVDTYTGLALHFEFWRETP